MISDSLLDSAIAIRQYRKDFDFYDANPAVAAWLDTITRELEALAAVVGTPPPSDDRTHRGECRECHEITSIRLSDLTCPECRASHQQKVQELLEFAMDGDPADPGVVEAHYEAIDAAMEAARTEDLNERAMRLVAWLRRLDRAERDYFLNAVTNGLLEAR
jgi:hypothetical protein